MKKLMIVLMATCLFAAIPAQAMVPAANLTASHDILEEKVPVEPSELPEAVQRTLDSDAYEGWEISKAYKVTPDEEGQLTHYEIHLMRETTTTVLTIDEEGQVVPENEQE